MGEVRLCRVCGSKDLNEPTIDHFWCKQCDAWVRTVVLDVETDTSDDTFH